ncbi:heme oxygenase-like protein [Poronia punctata]|nr:heme oxygenase-like protein [Poronia punctata]
MPSDTRDMSDSLPHSINSATRSIHTKLNKLVVSRLRLALPPQVDDASQYVSGLLHLTPVYITFESLWRALLDKSDQQDSHDCNEDLVCATLNSAGDSNAFNNVKDFKGGKGVIRSEIKTLLENLHFEGLQRSRALQNDLFSLTNWSNRTLAEKLNDATELPVLGEFINHIKTNIGESPHTLLAYAWVLYMALFSGGRFIRATLENIFTDFWIPASAQPATPPETARAAFITDNVPGALPFHFFRFDTPDDGEDLKLEFKRRLAESESILNAQEREEIVQEAQNIFQYMIRLVGELDYICGTDEEAAEARLLSLRSRDSVVVEKERRQHYTKLARKIMGEDTKANPKENGVGRVKFN